MRTDKDNVRLVSALAVLLIGAVVPAWSASGLPAPREQFGQAALYVQFLTDCSVNWTKNFAAAEVPMIRHLEDQGNWYAAKQLVDRDRAVLEVHRRLMAAKLANYNSQYGGGTIETEAPGGGIALENVLRDEHIPRIGRACDDAATTLSNALFG